MLIESYVIGFTEVKRCIASLRPNDFVVVSENIFMLRENAAALPDDLLSSSTPSNHPEAMLIINKNYAKDLILDSDAFAFRKPQVDVDNLAGVTLHLCFSGDDLLDDLIGSAKSASIDGVSVKTVTAQGVLLAKQQQQRRFDEHQEVLRRSLAVFRKDMVS
jgi:hypothetical protein